MISGHDTDVREFDELVEEICALLQSGVQLDVDELAEKHAHLADRIRSVFPALVALNNLDQTSLAGDEEAIDPLVTHSREIGDYRILRQIGRGGMGVVYEAEQLSMPRQVALKVLPLASLVDSRALQRFKNEVAAVATLEHPNIVPVYAVGEERGIHFYAMKLIRGQSLAAVIRELRARADREEKLSGDALQQAISEKVPGTFCRNGPPGAAHKRYLAPFPETVARGKSNTARRVGDTTYFRNVARLIQQAAEALQHAHDQGIVHRDIKPGNLLLDSTGTLYVTDFGLARIETGPGVTMTGDLLGTLRYMSPEQIAGNRLTVDHRTDVYSLGATLYELLTLQPMWTSEDKAELIRRISSDEPTAPRRINPQIPADLETIVLKAISKYPSERYMRIVELREDIDAWLNLKPIRAQRLAVIQRCSKWARRNPAIMWSGVVSLSIVMAMMIVGITGLSVANSRIRDEQSRTNARAEELKQVADFYIGVFDEFDSVSAGSILSTSVLAGLERHLDEAGFTDAIRTEQRSTFLQHWNQINPQDAASTLIDELILNPAAKEIEERFRELPLIQAELMQALADCYKSLSQYETARALQVSALETRTRLLGINDRKTVESTAKLGLILLKQEQFAAAEIQLRNATETAERLLGDLDSVTLMARSYWGQLLIQQGKSQDAIAYCSETLERARTAFGDQASETLVEINNLSYVLLANHEFLQAEELLRDVVDRVTEHDPGDELLYLTATNNLSVALLNQGKLPEANTRLREAIEIQRRIYGDRHPLTLVSTNNLGLLLTRQKLLDEAKHSLKQTLQIMREVLGNDHSYTLSAMTNLAIAYMDSAEFVEARELLQQVYEVQQADLPADHPQLALTLKNLANSYWRTNDLEKSIPLYERVLELQQIKLGRDNWEVQRTVSDVAINYLDAGRYSEAIPLLEEVYENMKYDPIGSGVGLSLVEACVKTQRIDRAKSVATELLDFSIKSLPNDSQELAGRMVRLCYLYFIDARELQHAESLLRKSLSIYLKNNGPPDWKVNQAQSLLGRVLLEQENYPEAEEYLLKGGTGLFEKQAMLPKQRQVYVAESIECLVQLYTRLAAR